MKKYEIIDHTADIGVKAYGKNLSEAFENAAKAMFDIITDNSKIKSQGEYKIDLKADNFEQLLVDFLSELLFIFETEHIVISKTIVELELEKVKLNAKIFGEEFDKSKHKMGAEIKAVTYHMLEVKKEIPYHVQVLFDI